MEPVSLQEIKEYLRLDGNDHDVNLSGLIIAARMYCESFQNRTYMPRKYEYTMDTWQFPIYLPKPPFVSIDYFAFVDENGDNHYFNDYVIDSNDQYTKIVLKYNATVPNIRLSELGGIRIRYVAGYFNHAVPQNVKLAIMMFVAHRFENPEMDGIPVAVNHLLWQDRVVPI